jgi:hypothetical protein
MQTVGFQCVFDGFNVCFGPGHPGFIAPTGNIRHNQPEQNTQYNQHHHQFDQSKTLLFLCFRHVFHHYVLTYKAVHFHDGQYDRQYDDQYNSPHQQYH